MGCFPEKTANKYQHLSPERQHFVKKYAQQHPQQDSVLIPIDGQESSLSIRSSGGNKITRKNQSGKTAAMPVKNREKYRGSKRALTVNSKVREPDQYIRRIVRKSTGERQDVPRKRGQITELPFRPHAIVMIQAPSESAKSSLLQNLERHPSLFFVKICPDLEMHSAKSNTNEGEPQQVPNSAVFGSRKRKSKTGVFEHHNQLNA